MTGSDGVPSPLRAALGSAAFDVEHLRPGCATAGAGAPPLTATGWPWDADGLAIVAKGGHNGEHHNHNDVGGFIIACDGVPVVIDAGRPTYTAATFGPDRYSIWTMQSTWHNVPEVAGEAQQAGQQYAATGTKATVAEDCVELALELGAAYPVPALRHWRWRVRLCRRASRQRG